MPHNDLPQPNRVQPADFAFVALCVAVLLLLVAVINEIALYKPSHREVLGLAAMVLISDACLLFAFWHGGTVLRVLTTLCGLVELVNTYAVLCYTLQTLF